MRDNDDGSHTLICPDGSSVRLPNTDDRQPTGGIKGTARLFGREDNAGIRVEVLGTDLVAQTADDGTFAIPGVPAGVHRVKFDAPGYEESERSGLMVLPGAWASEDVELGIGRRILQGGNWLLKPSPRGDIFLAQNGELFLVEPLALAATRIADRVQTADFRADGAQIVITTPPDSESRFSLYLYEVDARRKTKIADDVLRWQYTPDGDSVVFSRRPEGRKILEVYHHPSKRHAVVSQDVEEAAWKVSASGSSVLALAQTVAGPTLVAWDIAAESGTGLGGVSGPANTVPDFAPDGRSFVFQTQAADLVLWDGQRNETLVLEPGITSFSFGPDADQLLYVAEGALVHWDLRTRSRFEIATSVTLAQFSPDGGTVAYFRNDAGTNVLTTWDAETRASTRRATLEPPMGMRFSPDGSAIFVLDWTGALHMWAAGGLRTISPAAQALPQFSPDGSSFLFQDGTDLIWSRLGSTATTKLGGPVFDFPVLWDAAGDQLFFVTGGDVGPAAYGNAWLFRPESGALEQVGTGTHLSGADFLDTGSLLLLRRYSRSGFRGELALDGTPIGQGVANGYRYTRDGQRVVFVTEALPVRETGVLALWDASPAAPCREVEPGIVPVDGGVTDQLVGAEWLAWVATPAIEARDAGLYLSHWPREMPPPPPPPAPDDEETDDDNEADVLLPNETNE